MRVVHPLSGVRGISEFFGRGAPLVKVIDVKCPKCQRSFRTVPSVVENARELRCPACGSHMEISEPQPVSVLSTKKARSGA